jgi:hypothetical protein
MVISLIQATVDKINNADDNRYRTVHIGPHIGTCTALLNYLLSNHLVAVDSRYESDKNLKIHLIPLNLGTSCRVSNWCFIFPFYVLRKRP